MPAPEAAYRRQKAVLLAFAGVDDYNKTLVSAGVEIDVRWISKRTQMSNAQGTPVSVDATVIVDQDVAEGSLMWEGTLEDFNELTLTGTGAHDESAGIMEVVAVGKTPDLKARQFRRRLGLSWYQDEVNYA